MAPQPPPVPAVGTVSTLRDAIMDALRQEGDAWVVEFTVGNVRHRWAFGSKDLAIRWINEAYPQAGR